MSIAPTPSLLSNCYEPALVHVCTGKGESGRGKREGEGEKQGKDGVVEGCYCCFSVELISRGLLLVVAVVMTQNTGLQRHELAQQTSSGLVLLHPLPFPPLSHRTQLDPILVLPLSTRPNTCSHTHLHTHTPTHPHTHSHTHTHTRTRTRTHTHTHTHTHAHTHTTEQ